MFRFFLSSACVQACVHACGNPNQYTNITFIWNGTAYYYIHVYFKMCNNFSCSNYFVCVSLPFFTTHVVACKLYIPNKEETHTVTFSCLVCFLGSSNFINKIITTFRFVTKLQYDIHEYPYTCTCTVHELHAPITHLRHFRV